MYSDGWNPLMAAAVTSHSTTNEIACILLHAAGSAASSLSWAANKYGQTAAHIASRKGNHVLLGQLLKAAGNGIAVVGFPFTTSIMNLLFMLSIALQISSSILKE